MPIEIKELHIRVVVNTPQEGKPGPAPSGGSNADAGQKDAIVAECVEQVLQVLRNRTER